MCCLDPVDMDELDLGGFAEARHLPSVATGADDVAPFRSYFHISPLLPLFDFMLRTRFSFIVDADDARLFHPFPTFFTPKTGT